MTSVHEIIALKAALAWSVDAGADWPLTDMPVSMIAPREVFAGVQAADKDSVKHEPRASSANAGISTPLAPPLGTNEARTLAIQLALAAGTPEALKSAIAGFDGIGLKSTATNIVFSCGNPHAHIMIVADAPDAEDDRTGRPFAGADGVLLDKIIASIGLSRAPEASTGQSIYIAPMLNWRPPGNRSMTSAEIETTLPFIERHIQLIRPGLLVFMGGIVAKALLGSTESLSRLRGRWFDYLPVTEELRQGSAPIPAIVTHPPGFLLQNPGQKRAVWGDMLKILEKKNSIEL